MSMLKTNNSTRINLIHITILVNIMLMALLIMEVVLPQVKDFLWKVQLVTLTLNTTLMVALHIEK